MAELYDHEPLANEQERRHDGATDFESLMADMTQEKSALPELRPHQHTDYASLTDGEQINHRIEMPNTLADHFINFVTPFLIFLLVMPVLFYLLNVRFIYTTAHDANLRVFTIFFVIGVVALNRLIARDGSVEAFVYAFGLMVVVALYTIVATEYENVGAVARNVMDRMVLGALLTNMAMVVFVWWLVNRLTHECCVDESNVAGDIGLFAATSAQFRRRLRLAAAPPSEKPKRKSAAGVDEPWHGLVAYDPTDTGTEGRPPFAASKADFSQRLPERHPGMALFYFSVPVVLLFSLGLRVIQHLGMPAVGMGAYYMYVYIFCAFMLLAITCLRQLRAYFRLRKVAMPPVLPWCWLGLATLLVVVIMWGAANLPMPALPSQVYEQADTQIGVYHSQTGRYGEMTITPASLRWLQARGLVIWMERLSMLLVFMVLIYAVLKMLQWVTDLLLERRNQLPHWLSQLISFVAWLLFRMWPALRTWAFPKRRRRIQRHVSLSAKYDSPFSRPDAAPMPVRDHIAYAYEALRALAADVGKPPRPSSTPYEFLAHYPDELGTMKREAEELVRLYVIAAYSTLQTDERLEDRLRNFWVAFRIVRNNYVR